MNFSRGKLRAVFTVVRSLIYASLITFSFNVSAQTLAEKIQRQLGSSPTKTELMEFLLNHAPHGVDVRPDQVIIPKKYVAKLFGQKVARFAEMAQLSNSFMNPEAGARGYMTTDEIEMMSQWEFNPMEGQAFLIGHFVAPADKMQMGFTTEDVPVDVAEQIAEVSGQNASKILFFIHPDHPGNYDDFVEGGARNAPKNGWGIKWTHVGILPSGPRSVLMLDLENPNGPLIEQKVNLHMTMDHGLRLIVPEKASRSILASQLFQDNVSPAEQMKWGFRVIPEVMSVSLPFSHRSNVVRDPSLLFKTPGTEYVYAYSIFSPIQGQADSEILAMKWLSPRPTKNKFEKLARNVFAMIARPFAYNALVKGLYLEWHSANVLYAINDGELGDHIVLKDMEAIRTDVTLMLRNGGDASALQNYPEPFGTAKFTDAMGGNVETRYVGNKEYELESPGFLGKQYILHVRGKKETSSPKVGTTQDNNWGFSTIVDQARAFGINVLGLDLTNAEVERWMDEEMAAAFEDVLRGELGISKSDIPEVTAQQLNREVRIAKGYQALMYKDPKGIPADYENIYAKMKSKGGLVRSVTQLRAHFAKNISREQADPELQDLFRKEAERLTSLQRNTRRDWSNLSSTRNGGYYFLFHEQSRMLEARDNDGWVGFFSLEQDGSKGSQKFFEAYKKIKGEYPAGLTKRALQKCEQLLKSKDIFERGSFGDRVSYIFPMPEIVVRFAA